MCEQLRSKSLFPHQHSDPGTLTIPLEKFSEVARMFTYTKTKLYKHHSQLYFPYTYSAFSIFVQSFQDLENCIHHSSCYHNLKVLAEFSTSVEAQNNSLYVYIKYIRMCI